MRIHHFCLVLILVFIGCSEKPAAITQVLKDQPLTSYVNTFIGTGGHGHTYPGATMPFGMMQLSPDTRLDGWDGCSGYHYSDHYIFGFTHTHLSGTGVSDYGDILLMPTNAINFNNGANDNEGYGSHFSHDNEEAAPGYYKVLLDDTNIEVELTVTPRAGMHKYTYPTAENQFAILDLLHRDKVLDAKIEIVSDTEIQGYRHSSAWASDQRLYFNLKTSHSFTEMLQSPPVQGMPGGRKDALHFENPKNEPVFISIGISAVDEAGAKRNRETEIGDKTFAELRNDATAIWEKQLEKIVVNSPDHDVKANFYSALYHTMIAPNLYQDVDGRYRGMDLKIHQTSEFDYYTVFSLWDTYRATHPLYTIIEQDRTRDFIKTLLAKYDEGGIMPIWDLSANYTGCMIGYHGVPVIADAYLKGIRGFDSKRALKAMMHSANQNHLGLASYKSMGFIPVEEESESVSKTLEYGYDDWTIAQMAKAMNLRQEAKDYTKRAQSYKNLYNPATGFMQGRFRNTWFGPFDPFEVNFNYTEANAWQYSLYVPQDIDGLMNVMGGKSKLEAHLDTLFTAESKTSGRDQADITGLIGQYAHGNEPSHHMAYLYNFTNKPHKTQEKVHQIMTELYTNEPNGISGNEDCGQMSAWYVFSALGFYPVTPGSNQYIIGTPLVEKASLNLENGKTFTIVVDEYASENLYIQNAVLNGEELGRTYLYHDEIMKGGTLVFTMSSAPTSWGTTDAEIPRTGITENLITPAPFISKGDVAFKTSTTVELDTPSDGAKIYYSINASEMELYKQPFSISEKSILTTYAEKDGIKSSTLSTEFFKIDPNISITLGTEYANQYSAGGNDALIDGIKGARDFRTGAWQGYSNTNVEATVSLGEAKDIHLIQVSFLQDQRSWIFFPTQVEVWVSKDGTNYRSLGQQKIESAKKSEDIVMKTLEFKQSNTAINFVKLEAKNLGPVPSWHLGHPYDGKAWIFVDEIEIK